MSGASTDQLVFNETFSFDAEVAECFDNMLERSIPDYCGMREITRLVASRYANAPWHTVADVGSSLGESFRTFAEAGCRVLSVEPSEDMLSKQRQRFEQFGNVEYLKGRAEDVLPTISDDETIDLFVFCLTLQFMPRSARADAVRAAYRKLKEGGAVIVVQKDKTNRKSYDDLIVEKYYALKAEHGYSVESIETKKRALNGYMDIDSIEGTEALLKGAGFRYVNEYWRALNFSAFLAEK